MVDPSIHVVVDAASLLGGAAALAAVAVAWLTYSIGEYKERQNVYTVLRGVCAGLLEELEFSGNWAATAGSGYPLAQPMLDEWLSPHRLVWKFDYKLSNNLGLSPYVLYLEKLIQPFSRFAFSCDRFFFLLGELRQFALSRPDLFAHSLIYNTPRVEGDLQALPLADQEYFRAIQKMSHHVHTMAIGGEANPDQNCLYRTHKVALETLGAYRSKLSIKPRPKTFWIADIIGLLASVACIVLLVAWSFADGGMISVVNFVRHAMPI